MPREEQIVPVLAAVGRGDDKQIVQSRVIGVVVLRIRTLLQNRNGMFVRGQFPGRQLVDVLPLPRGLSPARGRYEEQ